MSETSSELPSSRLAGVAADAGLNLANTLGWRGRETPTEGLKGLPDLIRWAESNSGLDAEASKRWLDWAEQDEAGAQGQFEQAIVVREAIYRMFSGLASGRPVAAADLAILNRALAEAPERREVVAIEQGHAWQIGPAAFTTPVLLAPVLWSAADLLVHGDRSRIRQCANEQCLWLFVDASKNGTRRWCDMTSCGNRAKARRHYLRRKKV
jgi:predicted RNA-binding Zn ribbon-like protein